MTVRIATGADVAALAELRRAWTVEWSGQVDDSGYERAFAEWFAAVGERRFTWLASVDGEPVGMLNMAEFRRMPRPGRLVSRWGYIANLFVLERHRNGGIGGELLDAAHAPAARPRASTRTRGWC